MSWHEVMCALSPAAPWARPRRASLGTASAIPAPRHAGSCLPCRISPLPGELPPLQPGGSEKSDLQQRYPCSRGWKPLQLCPPNLSSLTSQNSKGAAMPSSLAPFCSYIFPEGLPAPAHPWQEFPEHFTGFFLQKFTFLVFVLNTYLVYYQHPAGVITSLHFCSGSQGNWPFPQVCLRISLVFVSPLQFLIYFLRVFTENTQRNSWQVRNTDIKSFQDTHLEFLSFCLRY